MGAEHLFSLGGRLHLGLLRLQDFDDDALLLDQKGTHDPLAEAFVAQRSSVCPGI